LQGFCGGFEGGVLEHGVILIKNVAVQQLSINCGKRCGLSLVLKKNNDPGRMSCRWLMTGVVGAECGKGHASCKNAHPLTPMRAYEKAGNDHKKEVVHRSDQCAWPDSWA
jgi:hypothetical protein